MMYVCDTVGGYHPAFMHLIEYYSCWQGNRQVCVKGAGGGGGVHIIPVFRPEEVVLEFSPKKLREVEVTNVTNSGYTVELSHGYEVRDGATCPS